MLTSTLAKTLYYLLASVLLAMAIGDALMKAGRSYRRPFEGQ